MADDQDKDSKTEAPSEKKISDATDKGNVPFSREVTAFASTLAIYIFVVFFLADGAANVAEALKDISSSRKPGVSIRRPTPWP